MIALEQLNALADSQFVAALTSIYEHSPWVPERVAGQRPFATVLALHEAMLAAVMRSAPAEQLALIRAHPELAGKAAIRGDLTPESTSEQKHADSRAARSSSTTGCTP